MFLTLPWVAAGKEKLQMWASTDTEVVFLQHL